MKSENPRQLEHVTVASGVLRRSEVRRLCLLGKLQHKQKRAAPNNRVEPGDELEIRNSVYKVVAGGRNRLGLHKLNANPTIITTPIKVHCGFHKCLTMYSRKIYRRASIALALSPAVFKKAPIGFHHFYHRKDAWFDNCDRYRISSLSGHSLDLDQFKDIKVVRFIRDPRDLIISSYYYHKRGGENWCKYKDPTNVDYEMVNGVVPSGIPEGQSLEEFLNTVPVEEGLAAEIEFRKHHLESMLKWPENDERLLTIRYEDILGQEADTFEKVFSFFQEPDWIIKKAKQDAYRFRAGAKEAKKGHVRNPKSQQWRKLFSPELNKQFIETYGSILERYRYPVE